MAFSDLDRPDPFDDSDIAMIRRTRMGDTDAYAVLHDRHLASARALAWRMSRSTSDADDLVAESFARVLAALTRGSGPEVAFRPYLLSTMRRLAYDRTGREAREAPTEHDLDEPREPITDPVIEGFERDTVTAAFASLPERWRLVLWHTEVEGQSPAQVAELLGIKPNAVAALAYRAREGLRQAYLGQHATSAPATEDRCRVTLDRLAAYVRGALSPTREAAVREHLDSCDDCRAAYLELASVNTSMRRAVGIAVLGPALGGYLTELATPSAPAVLGAGASGGSAAVLAGRLRHLAHPARAAAAAAVAGLVVASVVVASRPADHPPTLGEGATADTLPTVAPRVAPPSPPPAPPTSAPQPPAAPAPAAPAEVIPTGSTTAPPAILPPTTTLPPPTTTSAPVAPTTTVSTTTAPASPSELTVDLRSAGGLVAGRPGVLVADVGNAGPGPGRAVRLEVDLRGLTLRGTPYVARSTGGDGARAAADDWDCRPEASSRLVCTRDRVDLGSSSSISILVAAGPGTGPVHVDGSVSGTDDRAGPDATSSVDLPVAATGMAARFATVDQGDIVSTGNTLVSCDDAASGCRDARAGIGPGRDNGEFEMVPVDVDADATTLDSSEAALPVPAGADVVSAQLYWGGDLAAGPGGVAAPDPAVADRARVRPPTGGAVSVVAERVDQLGSRYQAVADVTDLVARAGGGSWTVGGVQLGTGLNAYGGWSLVVVSRDASAPRRSLVVLDGLSSVGEVPAATDSFDVGGFTVPASGTSHATFDMVTYEGDRGMTGDQLTVGGWVMADARNPLGDSFNASASSLGVDRTGRAPAFVNLFGLDIDRFDVADVLRPGSTSTRISLSSTEDVYLPGVVAITVDQ